MLDPLKPYEMPSDWQADHVLRRFVWAFDTLHRIRERVGPRGFGTGWPSYIYSFADRVAQEEVPQGSTASEAMLERMFSASNSRVVLPPSARDVDLMNEAFDWPLRRLKCVDEPIIVRWAKRRSAEQPTHRLCIRRVYDEAGRIVTSLKLDCVPVR